ncbi:MAG: helix-turn-helix transcriptional regulator [Acidaminococcaceae bacterium]|nr:helix-turn-helix transcriptional regulator [Acidaminococcaceae bacterium]
MDRYTIGKKIIAARGLLGLKQDEFGEQIGVAKQTISGWERGRTLPDIITLTRIAAMCGLTLNDFIDNPIIEIQNGITEKELLFIQKLRTTNPKTRQAIELLLDIKK